MSRVFAFWVSLAAAACGVNVTRSTEVSKDEWKRYEIHAEFGDLLVAVPRGHRTPNTVRDLRVNFGSTERSRQIFSAQFDYPWPTWRGIAQFEVVYSLLRVDREIQSTSDPKKIQAASIDAVEADLGRPTALREMAHETVLLGQWLRFFRRDAPTVETYITVPAPGFVLVVSPAYFGDLAHDLRRIEERRKILRRMVEAIEIRAYAE
jgi:hypothetical protein